MSGVRTFRETGKWGHALAGEELNARELDANRTLSLLRSRVDDEDLRAQLGVCQDISFQTIMVRTEPEAAALNRQLAQAVHESLTRAGDLIRELW